VSEFPARDKALRRMTRRSPPIGRTAWGAWLPIVNRPRPSGKCGRGRRSTPAWSCIRNWGLRRRR